MRFSMVAIWVLAYLSTTTPGVQRQAPGTSGANGNLFWCPMHPDVRSTTQGRCPICSMDLVAIPPPTIGNYRLQVRQLPPDKGSGVAALRIEIRDPGTMEPVTAFSPLHERLLHLFVVRRDLSYFSHVHPEFTDGAFEVPIDLEPGAYVLLADFAPAGGAPQLVHLALVTPGYKGSPFASSDLQPDLSDKRIDGVRVRLEAETRLLKPSVLRFRISHATTGAPIDDLEPFLGASGHLLIVNADLTTAMHAHPDGVDDKRRTPAEIVFAPTFGTTGVYKMWVQFQRAGRVITSPFAIAVR
jgi:hypothetical protein